MADVTEYRSLADRIMQICMVYEDTLCILMSATEEARRNRDVAHHLLGIVQDCLLREQERYLMRIWPTLKKVCGYEEKRFEVIPHVLERRDPQHREIARQLLLGITQDFVINR